MNACQIQYLYIERNGIISFFHSMHIDAFFFVFVNLALNNNSYIGQISRQPFHNTYSTGALLSLILLFAIAMESLIEKDRSSSILSFKETAV